jgi:hypothetical protein
MKVSRVGPASAAVAAEQTARLEANPLPLRTAEEIDGQVAIDEKIFAEVQRCADPVARVRGDCDALIRGRRLALDQRMVHAKPGGGGSVEEAPRRNPIFHQMAVTTPQPRHRNLDDRALVGRLRSRRRRMARSPLWNGRILLALHERRETRALLATRYELTGIMAGIAADIVGHDLDSAFADRRGPHQIYGQPPEMGQPVFGGHVFDRPADERGGETGVLMVGMPRAAGERARTKNARAEIDVSRIQGRGSSCPCAERPWRRGAFCA